MPDPAQPPRTHFIRQRDADILEKALGKLPRKSAAPALVVLSGLPGSGKSHFARALAAATPAAILDSDALRQALFPNPQHTPKEHGRLFPAIHALMERLLDGGVTVIADATNLKQSNRKIYDKIAADHGTKLILVRVWAPKTVIRQRMEARNARLNPADRSTATLDVYEQMSRDAEPIRRKHVSVDTSKDIKLAVDKVLLQLSASKA